MGKDTDMSTPGVLADCMKIIEDIRLYNVEGSYNDLADRLFGSILHKSPDVNSFIYHQYIDRTEFVFPLHYDTRKCHEEFAKYVGEWFYPADALRAKVLTTMLIVMMDDENFIIPINHAYAKNVRDSNGRILYQPMLPTGEVLVRDGLCKHWVHHSGTRKPVCYTSLSDATAVTRRHIQKLVHREVKRRSKVIAA